MAGTDGREDAPLIERLRVDPRAFDPLQALLILERGAAHAGAGRVAGNAPVGRDAHPRDEAVRFANDPELAFPAAEISAFLEKPGAAPTLVIGYMGLIGASGVLPQAYSEMVIGRLREKDTALAAFLDLFLHRGASFFMRAWTKYRLSAQEPGGADKRDATPAVAGVTGLIDALVGFGTGGLKGRLAPSHEAFRYYAGALAGHPRSAVALESVLSDFFGERILVDTFVPRWDRLPEADRTRLSPGGFCRLGGEAVIGEKTMRPEGAYRISLGPLTYARFRDFLPDRPLLRELVHFARLFTGEALYFDVRLTLRKEDVPPLKLDGGAMLGWNTWVSATPHVEDRDDATLSCDRVP